MDSFTEMNVTKRNGELQEVSFDKILNRVKKIGQKSKLCFMDIFETRAHQQKSIIIVKS